MIRLEYFERADFDQLISWIKDERLLTNWAGSLFRFPLTQESLEWYIEGTNNFPHSDAYTYKAIDTEMGNVVGHISLGSISSKNKAARITRVLVGDPAARGKGYCKQMMEAALQIGFEDLKLHRISLGAYDFNTAALRCYQRSGFVHEGLQRDVLKFNDEWWSLVEMGILESEWRALKRPSVV